MGSVLIVGADDFLGSYLSADHLLSARETGAVVRCALGASPSARATSEAAASVRHALRQLEPDLEERALQELLASRLRWEPAGAELPEPVDQMWCCSPELLGRLPRTSAAELSCVASAGEGEGDLEREVAQACAPRGMGWRIFRPGLVLGVPAPGGAPRPEGLLQLLWALHELKAEVEERDPEYFDHCALRVPAPAGAALNVILARHAVHRMRRLAGRPDTLGRCFDIAAPTAVPFADLCERLGMVYGLSLLAVGEGEPLNPVDRSFRDRLGGFQRHLRAPLEPDARAASRVSGADAAEAALDGEALGSLLEAVRDAQLAARDEARRRAAAVWESLERKTIQAGASELTYLQGGAGDPPVVILNALGQGLRYWTRLVDLLVAGGHRVLLWEPRGTGAARPFRLTDQVDDLEAVLRAEGVSRCHLLGWCTGPRVAMEFCLRRPEAVASAAFLNASFKSDRSPAELDSDYEQSLESLCRMLDRRPALVASVMSSLQSGAARDGAPQPEQDVLSRMNRELRPEVLAPFRTETSTLDYARQLVDFWSHDARALAGQVQAPVLLLGAELDQVASPAAAREVAKLFPDARCLEVRGATHYCLYDRPALVAGLLERFFADPRQGLDGLAAGVEQVA